MVNHFILVPDPYLSKKYTYFDKQLNVRTDFLLIHIIFTLCTDTFCDEVWGQWENEKKIEGEYDIQ